jgi:hypothetical protein
MPGAVREMACVLEPGGRLVLAVVHPINSAHELEREHPEHNLVLVRDYFERRRYADVIERDGLRMTFQSRHWTFQDYFDAILEAGFRVEAVREVGDPEHPRWSRYRLSLHIRAVLPLGSGVAPPQSGDESGTSLPRPGEAVDGS